MCEVLILSNHERPSHLSTSSTDLPVTWGMVQMRVRPILWSSAWRIHCRARRTLEEVERRGWNVNQCRHEVHHQLTLGRKVRCQSFLLSHQRVSWKGTWSSHEGFPQMGGALHSLAWAGPLHPSPDCRLSAEMLADQLSYAGRGKVNSNGAFILSVKQLRNVPYSCSSHCMSMC